MSVVSSSSSRDRRERVSTVEILSGSEHSDDSDLNADDDDDAELEVANPLFLKYSPVPEYDVMQYPHRFYIVRSSYFAAFLDRKKQPLSRATQATLFPRADTLGNKLSAAQEASNQEFLDLSEVADTVEFMLLPDRTALTSVKMNPKPTGRHKKFLQKKQEVSVGDVLRVRLQLSRAMFLSDRDCAADVMAEHIQELRSVCSNTAWISWVRNLKMLLEVCRADEVPTTLVQRLPPWVRSLPRPERASFITLIRCYVAARLVHEPSYDVNVTTILESFLQLDEEILSDTDEDTAQPVVRTLHASLIAEPDFNQIKAMNRFVERIHGSKKENTVLTATIIAGVNVNESVVWFLGCIVALLVDIHKEVLLMREQGSRACIMSTDSRRKDQQNLPVSEEEGQKLQFDSVGDACAHLCKCVHKLVAYFSKSRNGRRPSHVNDCIDSLPVVYQKLMTINGVVSRTLLPSEMREDTTLLFTSLAEMLNIVWRYAPEYVEKDLPINWPAKFASVCNNILRTNTPQLALPSIPPASTEEAVATDLKTDELDISFDLGDVNATSTTFGVEAERMKEEFRESLRTGLLNESIKVEADIRQQQQHQLAAQQQAQQQQQQAQQQQQKLAIQQQANAQQLASHQAAHLAAQKEIQQKQYQQAQLELMQQQQYQQALKNQQQQQILQQQYLQQQQQQQLIRNQVQGSSSTSSSNSNSNSNITTEGQLSFTEIIHMFVPELKFNHQPQELEEYILIWKKYEGLSEQAASYMNIPSPRPFSVMALIAMRNFMLLKLKSVQFASMTGRLIDRNTIASMSLPQARQMLVSLLDEQKVVINFIATLGGHWTPEVALQLLVFIRQYTANMFKIFYLYARASQFPIDSAHDTLLLQLQHKFEEFNLSDSTSNPGPSPLQAVKQLIDQQAIHTLPQSQQQKQQELQQGLQVTQPIQTVQQATSAQSTQLQHTTSNSFKRPAVVSDEEDRVTKPKKSQKVNATIGGPNTSATPAAATTLPLYEKASSKDLQEKANVKEVLARYAITTDEQVPKFEQSEQLVSKKRWVSGKFSDLDDVALNAQERQSLRQAEEALPAKLIQFDGNLQDRLLKAYLGYLPAYSPAGDTGVPYESLVVVDSLNEPLSSCVKSAQAKSFSSDVATSLNSLVSSSSAKGAIRSRYRANLPLRHMLRDHEDALDSLPSFEDFLLLHFKTRVEEENQIETIRSITAELPVEMCNIMYNKRTREERRVCTTSTSSFGEVNMPSSYASKLKNNQNPDPVPIVYGQHGIWSDRDVYAVMSNCIPTNENQFHISRQKALKQKLLEPFRMKNADVVDGVMNSRVLCPPGSANFKFSLANPFHPYRMSAYTMQLRHQALGKSLFYNGADACTCGNCGVHDPGYSISGSNTVCRRDACRCCSSGSIENAAKNAHMLRNANHAPEKYYKSISSIFKYQNTQTPAQSVTRRLLGVDQHVENVEDVMLECHCHCHSVRLNALDFIPVVRRRRLDVKSFKNALITDLDHDSSDDEGEAETTGTSTSSSNKKKKSNELPKLPNARSFSVHDSSFWLHSLLTTVSRTAVTIDASLFPYLPVGLIYSYCNVLGLELRYKASQTSGVAAGTDISYTKYGVLNNNDPEQVELLSKLTDQDSWNKYNPSHHRSTHFSLQQAQIKRHVGGTSMDDEMEGDMLDNVSEQYLSSIGVISNTAVVLERTKRKNVCRFDQSCYEALYRVSDATTYDMNSLVRFIKEKIHLAPLNFAAPLYTLVHGPKVIDVACFGNVISEVDTHSQITSLSSRAVLYRRMLELSLVPKDKWEKQHASLILGAVEKCTKSTSPFETVVEAFGVSAKKVYEEKTNDIATAAAANTTTATTTATSTLDGCSQDLAIAKNDLLKEYEQVSTLPSTHNFAQSEQYVRHSRTTPSILSTGSLVHSLENAGKNSLVTPLAVNTTMIPNVTKAVLDNRTVQIASIMPTGDVAPVMTTTVSFPRVTTELVENTVNNYSSKDVPQIQTIYHNNIDIGYSVTPDNMSLGYGNLIRQNNLLTIKSEPSVPNHKLNQLINNDVMREIGAKQPRSTDAALVPANSLLLKGRVLAPVGSKTGFFADLATVLHSMNEKGYHYESPQRVLYILQFLHLEGIFLYENLDMVTPLLPTIHDFLLTHRCAYLEELFARTPYQSQERNNAYSENYNSVYLTDSSALAVVASIGGMLNMVRKVVLGDLKNGFCLTRPPGHHSDGAFPSGFCLVNNVSIAAQYAVSVLGLERVMIVDWDIHYGDGTQELFEHDPNVFVFNIHLDKNGQFFPAVKDTQSNGTVGVKKGEGSSMNVTWNREGMTDGDYLYVVEQLLLPICEEYAPELIIVSAGFDGGRGDPLGKCHVTPECYARITHMLMQYARGKLVLALEGGYNQHTIAASTGACIKALAGKVHEVTPLRPVMPTSHGIDMVNQVKRVHEKYWASIRKK